MKRFSWTALLPVILAFLVPAAAVFAFRPGPAAPLAADPEPVIRVYRAASHSVTPMPLENYVAGVVAAEMPANFQMEALKAQAVAARTNAVRALAHPGQAPGGADISDDHTQDQAFLSTDQLQRQWGSQFAAKFARIQQAVRDTAGQILVYGGQPIDATFFSTSNGYTASAQEVWGKNLPYLQSVPSPWDASVAPRFQATKTLSVKDVAAALHLTAVPATPGGSFIQVLQESPTHRITQLRVGDRVVSGNDFRTALGLNSTSFTWTINGGEVTFRTTGYGHGVGMSQYGAEALAQQGKTAQEILQYYYRGTQVVPWSKTLILAAAKGPNR